MNYGSKSKKTGFSSSIRRFQKGFTLVELIIVLSVAGILGGITIAGFNSYNKSQILQTSANEVMTMLDLAKSRAQSQIKPQDTNLCPNNSDPNLNFKLYGYKVEIVLPNKYTLYVTCSDTGIVNPATDTTGDRKIDEQDKQLPRGLNFDTNHSFFFPVGVGGVSTGDTLIISDDGLNTKNIEVTESGIISIN